MDVRRGSWYVAKKTYSVVWLVSIDDFNSVTDLSHQAFAIEKTFAPVPETELALDLKGLLCAQGLLLHFGIVLSLLHDGYVGLRRTERGRRS